jgi:DNA-binding transcriptional LysR family regulator
MLDLRQLDLNLLLAFDAIYQQRSVTACREVMCLSQPAMSNALRRLRELCGDPLFIKSRLGVTPTLVAHRLADYVRNALESLREGLRMIPPRGRAIRYCASVAWIACNRCCSMHCLNRRMPTGRCATFSHVDATPCRNLASGKLDILIDIDQPLAGLNGLHKRSLPADHYVFAYGEALKEPPRTLQAYLQQPQIQMSSRRDGLSPVDLHLGLKGYAAPWR